MHVNTLSISEHYYLSDTICFSILFITHLLNLRGVTLLFIFKCLYTCIYRMKIDSAFLFE